MAHSIRAHLTALFLRALKCGSASGNKLYVRRVDAGCCSTSLSASENNPTVSSASLSCRRCCQWGLHGLIREERGKRFFFVSPSALKGNAIHKHETGDGDTHRLRCGHRGVYVRQNAGTVSNKTARSFVLVAFFLG